MFRGNHPATIDEKARLKVPVAFKQQLDARLVTQVYVTSSDGRSAEIWPLEEWEKRYYGQQVAIDSQGRVLVPQILRGAAKLNGEVAVMGKINYLEVYNLAMLEEGLPATVMNSDDRKAVAAVLSRQV
jgi:MraZ protein